MKRIKTKDQGGISKPAKNEARYIHVENMDAIACGVQSRLEEKTSFSRRVTDETVETARTLGFSNSIIEIWATRRLNRLAQETQRLQEIKALLERTYRNNSEVRAKTRDGQPDHQSSV
jgi:hypothetical protein